MQIAPTVERILCVFVLWWARCVSRRASAAFGSKRYWQTHQSWWCIGPPPSCLPLTGAVGPSWHAVTLATAACWDGWRPAEEKMSQSDPSVLSYPPKGLSDPCLCPPSSICLLCKSFLSPLQTHRKDHIFTNKVKNTPLVGDSFLFREKLFSTSLEKSG